VSKTSLSKCLSGTESLVIDSQTMSVHESLLSEVLRESNDQVPQDLKREELSAVDEEEYYWKVMDRGEGEERYREEREIGAGGMGTVNLVFDADFLRYSAMKVILPEIKCKPEALAGFIREARITAELEHPNIIPVHDMGYAPDRGMYFTMKHATGEPLVQILRQIELGNPRYREKYNFFALLAIFRKVCDAVAYAHSRNVIHRDIKPHNIMVGDYGEVLLMDWGLAKYIDADAHVPAPISYARRNVLDATATGFGMIKGSPAYMSPEQASGEPDILDRRSDVFLLGATLYHIFTLYPPYLADDIMEIVSKARRAEFTPPASTRTGWMELPEELSQIIEEAMAADPNERYEDVESLCGDLDSLIRGDMHFGSRTFEPGDVMIQEGDIGYDCYVIIAGKVAVLRGGSEIAMLGPGDIVGEMALITHEFRSATVKAVERTQAYVLTQDLFTRNLKKLPSWMAQMIVTLAERLRECNSRIAEHE